MYLIEQEYFKLYTNLLNFHDKATPVKTIHFKKLLE